MKKLIICLFYFTFNSCVECKKIFRSLVMGVNATVPLMVCNKNRRDVRYIAATFMGTLGLSYYLDKDIHTKTNDKISLKMLVKNACPILIGMLVYALQNKKLPIEPHLMLLLYLNSNILDYGILSEEQEKKEEKIKEEKEEKEEKIKEEKEEKEEKENQGKAILNEKEIAEKIVKHKILGDKTVGQVLPIVAWVIRKMHTINECTQKEQDEELAKVKAEIIKNNEACLVISAIHGYIEQNKLNERPQQSASQNQVIVQEEEIKVEEIKKNKSVENFDARDMAQSLVELFKEEGNEQIVEIPGEKFQELSSSIFEKIDQLPSSRILRLRPEEEQLSEASGWSEEFGFEISPNETES
jgi:hypothetical protein